MAKKKRTSTPKSSSSRTGKQCLTCNQKAIRCGLCGTCYHAAYRRIRLGQVSREELEDEGLILPPRRGGFNPWTEAAAKVLRKGGKGLTSADTQ